MSARDRMYDLRTGIPIGLGREARAARRGISCSQTGSEMDSADSDWHRLETGNADDDKDDRVKWGGQGGRSAD